ncbi:type I secretion target repeat protein [Ketogulonicigenium robustum]|uniref:Type I secretion target repeat protein n=1 Tax=Ketogulonicigenium robustum TaxID=92947 RepID=A0A1W6NWP1_9RHOB|nr:Hint domain-containing protein [Ketogulonicigenium robustum]ARO13563.1 type I secretion target repeat protein [Ketogulonicigenium robustum]
MAISIIDGGTYVINAQNVNDPNLLNLNLLGSATIIVDGVDFKSSNILLNLNVASNVTWQTQNGASLTIESGLLGLNLLSGMDFVVGDTSKIDFHAAGVTALGVLLTPSYDVTFTGAGAGVFNYTPANIAVLGHTFFNVSGMGAKDQFILNGGHLAVRNYNAASEVLTLGRTADSLLVNLLAKLGLVYEDVSVRIGMSQKEYAEFTDKAGQGGIANQGSAWLLWNTSVGTYTDPCFAEGTLITTGRGAVPVQDLRAGDLVLTKDKGLQPIKWVGRSHLDAAMLDMRPNMLPVRIAKGALGAGMPHTDLTVSPQHRMVVSGDAVHAATGNDEAFIAAKHMTNLPGVSVMQDATEVTYYHILLDAHSVIFANGAPSESFFLGDYTRRTLNPRLMAEVRQVVPGVDDPDFSPVMARPALRGRDAREVLTASCYAAD